MKNRIHKLLTLEYSLGADVQLKSVCGGHCAPLGLSVAILAVGGLIASSSSWAADELPFADRYVFNQNQSLNALGYAAQGGDAASTAFALAKGGMTNYLFPSLGQNAPDWAKRIEFEVDVQQNLKPTYSILTVQPLYQDAKKQNTFFVQASQLRYDMLGEYRDTTNLGLGYRRLLGDNSVLVGVNTFYDYEWTYKHQRVGLGGEVKWAMLDGNVNLYKAISSEKLIDAANGISERAMSGWDTELRSQVPYLPWLQVGAKYYRWNSDYADDTKGWRYSASADISQNLSVEAGWSRDNYNSSNGFAKVVLRLARTDRPAMLSDKFISNKAFEQRDMRVYTLDKVRRENRIMVERKTTTTTGSVIVARGN